MSKEFSEPDEKVTPAAEQPIPDQDMLTSERVIDRTHAQTSTTGPTANEWVPPPFTGNTTADGPDEQPDEPQDHPLANPGLKDAPPHVKKKGAEFFADKILKGWGKGKRMLGMYLVVIPDSKLDDLEERGLIDRNIVLKMHNGTMIPAGMVIQKHNNDAEKIIDQYCLTKEFYDEAMPMLVEELTKHDIALTNLQMLGVTAGMDLYNFGEKLFPQFMQGKDIINAFKETTAAVRQNGGYQQNFNTGQPPGPQQAAPVPDPVSPIPTMDGNTGNVEFEQDHQPPPPVAETFDRENAVADAFDTIQSGGGNIIAPHAELKLPGEFMPKPQIPGNSTGNIKRPYTKRTTTKKKKRGGTKKHKLFS